MKVVKLKTRPNILVIITDQQRFDTLSCYGNNWIKTPNIDPKGRIVILFDDILDGGLTLSAATSYYKNII